MGVKGIHPLLSQDTEEGGLKVFFQKSYLNFYKIFLILLPLGIWLGSFRVMNFIANKAEKKKDTKLWPEAVWLLPSLEF